MSWVILIVQMSENLLHMFHTKLRQCATTPSCQVSKPFYGISTEKHVLTSVINTIVRYNLLHTIMNSIEYSNKCTSLISNNGATIVNNSGGVPIGIKYVKLKFVLCFTIFTRGLGVGVGFSRIFFFMQTNKSKRPYYQRVEKQNPASSLTVFVWIGEVNESSNLKIQSVHCVFSTQSYFHRLHMLLKDRRDSFIKCF